MDKMLYHLFANQYTYYGPFRKSTSVDIVRYNAEKVEKEELTPNSRDVKNAIKEGFINWIRVAGLVNTDFIADLLATLGFHTVDSKSIINPCHASKFNSKNKRLLIVLRSCQFNEENELVTEHLALIGKDNYVITFRELSEPISTYVEQAIEENVLNVKNQDYIILIALLLNNIFSQMNNTVIQIEDMLERLDNILLDATHNRLNIARRIENCRNANLILQKNTVMLYKEFKEFIAKDKQVNSNEETSLIYDELLDQLEYIVLTSINCKELLTSMRDLYTSNNELRTNTIMKRLSIVSTLFIPITFLVGLWGMNFKYMPELAWRFSYPLVLIFIGITAYCTWQYMRRNNWF